METKSNHTTTCCVQIGSVVKSIAGHDADRFYVVVKLEGSIAFIADGKRRKLEKPKPKKQKHLSKTITVLQDCEFTTNLKIRRALWGFNCQSTPLQN